MFVLYGYEQVEGKLEQWFTLNERELALHIAQAWNQKRLKPVLVERNYRGEETEVFSYRQRKAA